MRVHIREKTYKCGDYGYVHIFPVFAPSGNRRQRRYKPTSETQKQLNEKYARERLVMLLETNFTGEGYYITPTYKDEYLPPTDEQAFRDVSNYIRRIKYRCEKNNVAEPCAVWCTEKSKAGRYHHHIIIKCGLSRDELDLMWGKGYCNTKLLQFNENGLEGLANYLPKNPIGKQRYHCTRNLKKPVERQNDNMSKKQARALSDTHVTAEEIERYYPDYYVVKDSITHYSAEYLDITYTSFKLYKKKSSYIKPS